MQKILIPSLLLLALIALVSCSEPSGPTVDKENFTRIYDNNQFDSAYYPIDIKETADGGYLILAKKKSPGEFSGVYLLKTNELGEYSSENNFSANTVNPVGQLMLQGDAFYFIAMDAITKNAQLIAVDAKGSTVSTTNLGVNYPSASSADGNDFILLGYNNVDKVTVLATLDVSGNILSQQSFTVGVGGETQVEQYVINSFFQYGRRLPFLVGRIPGGLYYFNGFYNYTFSLVFTDLSSSNPDGLIQGQHDAGGFSAALPLGGNKFAASVFNFGDNYVLTNQNLTISASSPQIAVELGGFTLPELVPNATIRIMKATIANKETLIFAGDTKSKQIGLWFYDAAGGELLSTKYLGFSNPFEIGNLIQTTDGGLAVCGTTYIAGRFPRACMFKISKENLNGQQK